MAIRSSRSTACLRRVRLLEESGLIAGYVMLLDPDVAGLSGAAFVSVTLDQQGRATLDRFEQDVRRHPEIIECYLLAGASDYLLRVAFRDARDFERIHTDILTRLPGVSRVQSTLALRTNCEKSPAAHEKSRISGSSGSAGSTPEAGEELLLFAFSVEWDSYVPGRG